MSKNYNSVLTQAHTALATGQFENAIALCEKVLCQDTVNIEALTIAGSCSVALNKAIQAEGYFQKAVDTSSQNGELHFMLGNALFGQQKLAEALKCYAKAQQLGCSDEVKQKIYYLIGLINQVQGQPSAALINYEKSEQIPVPNVDQIDILLKRIQIYVESNDLTNAENYAVQLKLLAPETFNSYQLLFQILLQQKKIEEAATVLDEATKYCSTEHQAKIEIGFDRALLDCFRAEENPNQMKQFYNSAILHLNELAKYDSNPNDVQCEVDVTLSEIYLKLGDISKAMEYSEKVTNHTNADDETLIDYATKARFILLECHMNLKEYKKALPFAALLKCSQNTFYRHHGYYSEAFATKQLAAENLSLREQTIDLYCRAIAYYKNCTVLSPADLMAYVYRIKAYADIGKYEKAYELSKVLTDDIQKNLQEYIRSSRKNDGNNGVQDSTGGDAN